MWVFSLSSLFHTHNLACFYFLLFCAQTIFTEKMKSQTSTTLGVPFWFQSWFICLLYHRSQDPISTLGKTLHGLAWANHSVQENKIFWLPNLGHIPTATAWGWWDGCHDFWPHQDHAGKHAGENNYAFYGPFLCSSSMVLACIVYDQMCPVTAGRGHRYFHATLSKNVSQFGLLLRQTLGYRDFIWEMIPVLTGKKWISETTKRRKPIKDVLIKEWNSGQAPWGNSWKTVYSFITPNNSSGLYTEGWGH